NLFDEARTQIIQNASNEARLREAYGVQLKRSEEQASRVADDGRAEIGSATWTSAAITALTGIIVGIMGVMIARSLLRQLAMAAGTANRVAAGDLTSDIRAETRDEMGKVLVALKKMNEGLTDIVSGVRHGADSMALAAAEIATGNVNLSSRT